MGRDSGERLREPLDQTDAESGKQALIGASLEIFGYLHKLADVLDGHY